MGESAPLDVSLLRKGNGSALGLARYRGLPRISRLPLSFVGPPARRPFVVPPKARPHKNPVAVLTSPSASVSQANASSMPGCSYGNSFGRDACPQRRTQQRGADFCGVGLRPPRGGEFAPLCGAPMGPREAFRCGESLAFVIAGGPVEAVNGPGRRLGLDAARKSRICGSRQAGGQPSRT